MALCHPSVPRPYRLYTSSSQEMAGGSSTRCPLPFPCYLSLVHLCASHTPTRGASALHPRRKTARFATQGAEEHPTKQPREGTPSRSAEGNTRRARLPSAPLGAYSLFGCLVGCPSALCSASLRVFLLGCAASASPPTQTSVEGAARLPPRIIRLLRFAPSQRLAPIILRGNFRFAPVPT